MINLIYDLPNFALFFLFYFLLLIFSFLALFLIHRKVPLSFRYQENAAVISISELIGIIYAVLVGFTILYELNSFNKADQAEKEEAKLMFTIYRQARALPEPERSTIRDQIVLYANNAIFKEWPDLSKGHSVDKTGLLIINNISNSIYDLMIKANLSDAVRNAINNLSLSNNALFDAHQERVSLTTSSLSPSLWFVLILGSLLTVAINFILGMHIRLHLACVAGIAMMVSAVFYLIVTLDRPYRGDFSIEPKTFLATLEYINLHHRDST